MSGGTPIKWRRNSSYHIYRLEEDFSPDREQPASAASEARRQHDDPDYRPNNVNKPKVVPNQPSRRSARIAAQKGMASSFLEPPPCSMSSFDCRMCDAPNKLPEGGTNKRGRRKRSKSVAVAEFSRKDDASEFPQDAEPREDECPSAESAEAPAKDAKAVKVPRRRQISRKQFRHKDIPLFKLGADGGLVDQDPANPTPKFKLHLSRKNEAYKCLIVNRGQREADQADDAQSASTEAKTPEGTDNPRSPVIVSSLGGELKEAGDGGASSQSKYSEGDVEGRQKQKPHEAQQALLLQHHACTNIERVENGDVVSSSPDNQNVPQLNMRHPCTESIAGEENRSDIQRSGRASEIGKHYLPIQIPERRTSVAEPLRVAFQRDRAFNITPVEVGKKVIAVPDKNTVNITIDGVAPNKSQNNEQVDEHNNREYRTGNPILITKDISITPVNNVVGATDPVKHNTSNPWPDKRKINITIDPTSTLSYTVRDVPTEQNLNAHDNNIFCRFQNPAYTPASFAHNTPSAPTPEERLQTHKVPQNVNAPNPLEVNLTQGKRRSQTRKDSPKRPQSNKGPKYSFADAPCLRAYPYNYCNYLPPYAYNQNLLPWVPNRGNFRNPTPQQMVLPNVASNHRPAALLQHPPPHHSNLITSAVPSHNFKTPTDVGNVRNTPISAESGAFNGRHVEHYTAGLNDEPPPQPLELIKTTINQNKEISTPVTTLSVYGPNANTAKINEETSNETNPSEATVSNGRDSPGGRETQIDTNQEQDNVPRESSAEASSEMPINDDTNEENKASIQVIEIESESENEGEDFKSIIPKREAGYFNSAINIVCSLQNAFNGSEKKLAKFIEDLNTCLKQGKSLRDRAVMNEVLLNVNRTVEELECNVKTEDLGSSRDSNKGVEKVAAPVDDDVYIVKEDIGVQVAMGEDQNETWPYHNTIKTESHEKGNVPTTAHHEKDKLDNILMLVDELLKTASSKARAEEPPSTRDEPISSRISSPVKNMETTEAIVPPEKVQIRSDNGATTTIPTLPVLKKTLSEILNNRSASYKESDSSKVPLKNTAVPPTLPAPGIPAALLPTTTYGSTRYLHEVPMKNSNDREQCLIPGSNNERSRYQKHILDKQDSSFCLYPSYPPLAHENRSLNEATPTIRLNLVMNQSFNSAEAMSPSLNSLPLPTSRLPFQPSPYATPYNASHPSDLHNRYANALNMARQYRQQPSVNQQQPSAEVKQNRAHGQPPYNIPPRPSPEQPSNLHKRRGNCGYLNIKQVDARRYSAASMSSADSGYYSPLAKTTTPGLEEPQPCQGARYCEPPNRQGSTASTCAHLA